MAREEEQAKKKKKKSRTLGSGLSITTVDVRSSSKARSGRVRLSEHRWISHAGRKGKEKTLGKVCIRRIRQSIDGLQQFGIHSADPSYPVRS